MLQDQVTTSKEQVTRLTAERADALAEVADLKKSLKASEVIKPILACFSCSKFLCFQTCIYVTLNL